MPKLGMEPIRKAALVKATIVEIGRAGSLDVTVSQIAKRAGMSSALAHHYFGSKEEIFLAAMRHILSLYGAEVRGALAAADGPQGAAAGDRAGVASPRQLPARGDRRLAELLGAGADRARGEAAAGGLSAPAAVEPGGRSCGRWPGTRAEASPTGWVR